TAVKTRCVPSGLNVKLSLVEKVSDVGYASRSPGVTLRGVPALSPSKLITNRCWRLSSTYSSQWRKKSRVKFLARTGFFVFSSARFLLAASLSANGLLEYSGQTAEAKAICLPSRDQMAVLAPLLMVVSCRASPPSRSMIQSWLEPLRLDSKRMRLPSGLQR